MNARLIHNLLFLSIPLLIQTSSSLQILRTEKPYQPNKALTEKASIIPDLAYPLPLEILNSENIANLESIATLGEGSISGFAISPDKQTLAVRTGLRIHLYESETFKEVRVIDVGFSDRNTDQKPLAYSPNGKLLVYSNGIFIRILNLG